MKDQQRAETYKAGVENSSESYDVAIVGGGMAGLSLALQIKKARPATRILVVEKNKHPVPEAAHKVGESTQDIAGHYLRDVLGLEEVLQTQQLRKFGMRMFFSTDDNQDITRRVEFGHSVLPPRKVATYQLDRGRWENTLGNELRRQGITFLDGCKVQQIFLCPQADQHSLHILYEGKEREIEAHWIVDASGRNALLKRQLGLAKPVTHSANAVWFRIGHRIDIGEWSDNPDWQARIRESERWLSTNHLMGPGYWVWLIPLASGSTSIGIVADATLHPFEEMNLIERAMNWLHTHEPQCAAMIEPHLADVQDFRVMKNYAYSCQQVFSSERWCLTGEAGVFLDPLYSPGGDLIAISNGLVCDLIIRELKGENIQERAQIYDRLFLILTDGWLTAYAQQYFLMGSAQIMVAKILWDSAFYWGVLGLLYFHNKFCSIHESQVITANLLRVSLLSRRVQDFFREWYRIDQSTSYDVFTGFYEFDFMRKLHSGMTAGLSDPELEAQFAANIHLLELLVGQLACTVIEMHADDTQDEAIQSQIRLWRTEPFLAELMALYRQEEKTHPIDGGWITLGQRRDSSECLWRKAYRLQHLSGERQAAAR